MTRLTSRQVTALLVLAAVAIIAWVAAGTDPRFATYALAVAIAGAAAVLFAAGDGNSVPAADLSALRTTVRRMSDGKRPEPPPGVPITLIGIYEALGDSFDSRSNRAVEGLQDAAQSASAVVRVLTDGVAKARTVTIVDRTPTECLISAGLATGDSVITTNAADLQDGQKVSVN